MPREPLQTRQPHGTGHAGFQKGMAKPAGSGRKKGQSNNISTLLKEEIIQAARELGDLTPGKDGKAIQEGRDELRGYLKYLGRKYPKTYAHLLARVLPYQVNMDARHEHKILETPEEIEADLRSRGLPVPKNMFN